MPMPMVLALLALVLPSAPAHAQAPPIEFKCPQAGTVTEIATANGHQSVTNRGADPSDPALCLWQRGTSPGASLYGIYGPDLSAQRGADIRRGMDALFAGAPEVSFRFQSRMGNARVSVEDTWQRAGEETLTIEGRAIPTHVFLRTSVSQDRNFKGVWRRWYDPVSQEWVKRELIEANQPTASDDYLASRLPLP